MTAQLLDAAANLSSSSPATLQNPTSEAYLAQFLTLYRKWIIFHRGMAGSLDTWLEQSKLLVHCMVGTGTLEEAVEIATRFAKAFWSDYIETEVRTEGDVTVIVFREPFAEGADGVIFAMWPLIATLSRLEFAVGGTLRGISARLKNAECLPPGLVSLLFRGPITYGAPEAALVIPTRELRRPVVACAGDIPAYFERFMFTTVEGSRKPPEMRLLVEAVIQSDKRRDVNAPMDLPSVAARLGCSIAKIKRHLRNERTTFRVVKDRVVDDLAKTLLKETDHTIEQIAGMLGYSDTYGFRRAFRRRNAVPPLAYRMSSTGRGGTPRMDPTPDVTGISNRL